MVVHTTYYIYFSVCSNNRAFGSLKSDVYLMTSSSWPVAHTAAGYESNTSPGSTIERKRA